jgi:hypothetical protein
VELERIVISKFKRSTVETPTIVEAYLVSSNIAIWINTDRYSALEYPGDNLRYDICIAEKSCHDHKWYEILHMPKEIAQNLSYYLHSFVEEVWKLPKGE